MVDLNLVKPIVFFDLETTGVSKNDDKIVQIALIKIFPNGDIIEKCRLINPNTSIPLDATQVHGITNEMVENEPLFQHISKSLYGLFEDSDVGGFNSRNFDLPFLRNEFKRCGIEYNYLDHCDIDVFLFEKHLRRKLKLPYKLNEKISLADLYFLYTNKKLEGAHDALNDVRGTIEVLNGQLKKLRYTTENLYDEIPNNGTYTNTDHNPRVIEDDGNYYWNFGKYIGKPIDINYNYAKWFITVENFPINEREIVKEKLKIL
jgi:DNA polymerase-3 subunit epsilon